MSETPHALIARAAIHYRAGDFDAAAQCGLDIVARVPDHFDALHLLGVLCLNRGQSADAANYLTRAARSASRNTQSCLNLGNAWLALKCSQRAEAAFRLALAFEPDCVDASIGLGIALTDRNNIDEGIAAYRAALAHQPNNAAIHFNLGKALVALDRRDEALESYRAALACAPPDMPAARIVDILHNLGGVLVDLDRPEEALALFDAEQARRSVPLALDWNRSLLQLQIGDYAAGWRDYESRWTVEGHDKPRPDSTIIDLSCVAGQRILLTGEQGRGDIVQFVRYAPLLAERGATVYLSVYDDLKRLLCDMPGIAKVFGEDENIPLYDITTPLLSLPLAFGTTIDTIPACVPYLRAAPDRVAAWQEKFGPNPDRRVGLTWSSTNPGAARSTDLTRLRPLLDCPGISFHALQKDTNPDDLQFMQRDGRIRDHRAELSDFAETAALIEALDLVIAIDTGVAHLAGALGKPVWVMLPHVAEWRWLRHRSDSPWYPSARLFRQTAPGDWDELARRVAAALTQRR